MAMAVRVPCCFKTVAIDAVLTTTLIARTTSICVFSTGREVSEYLRRQLHVNVEKVLREGASKGVEECLKAAFVMTGAHACQSDS